MILLDPLIVVPKAKKLILTSTAPAPDGTDVVNTSGNAIVSGDLAIRDTSVHTFVIPVGAAWFRRIWLACENGLDQNLTLQLDFEGTSPTDTPASMPGGRHLNFTFSSGNKIGIGPGEVGVGGSAGADPSTGNSFYSLNGFTDGPPYVKVKVFAGTSPTTGEFKMAINRLT